MARAASTAAGLRRTDISAVNANDVYAQKCSTLKLMCKLLRAPITDDSGESSEPMTTQQIWTAQTSRIRACRFSRGKPDRASNMFCSGSMLSLRSEEHTPELQSLRH